MDLFCISLTDDKVVYQNYTSRTPEIPSGSARKAWLNLHKMFYPFSKERIHELRNKFTICTLNRDGRNPAIWFAQLNKIHQKLIKDSKLTLYEDGYILQQIIYNTKPAMYQIILGFN
jgi:hypothetical protein